MLKSDWGCLSVHVLESVFMVDLRWLRKCRAVGRVSVLAGCRMSLLPLGLPALRGVSRGLRNFQKRRLSLSLLFLCFFSPGEIGALGENKYNSDSSSAAQLAFFSQTFALCSLLPFCTGVLCMGLTAFSRSSLS